MPKVTVIVPNYNHAGFLEKRIESILQQTYTDFEIILLDDCSTDTSKAVLDKYSKHPKVSKTIYNKTNSGSTFLQWQKGIQESQGEYIWIAESDDFADKMFLEVLLDKLEASATSVLAYAQSWMVDTEDRIIGSCREKYPTIPANITHSGKQVIAHYMAGANLIPNASAVVFKKQPATLISDLYTKFKFSGDWWFWCELLMQGDLIHVGDELNYFRQHQQKVTVLSKKKGLYFTEGLQILSLLKHNKYIAHQTYINKSKNWANAFYQEQLSKSGIGLTFKTQFQVLKRAYQYNTLFVWRVIYLFLIRKILHL